MLRDRGQGSKVIRADYQSLSLGSKRIGGRRREEGGEERRKETYNNPIPLSLSNLFPIQSKEIRSFM